MATIYKILPASAWNAACEVGEFSGAEIDIKDGFIHFSAADQVVETAARHFAGQSDLLLVAVESTQYGDALKWEVSRGGALFPHLYAAMSANEILWAKPLPLGSDGYHHFPSLAAKPGAQ